MERHINILAALHIGLSILGLILGITLFTLFNIMGDFIGDQQVEFILSVVARVMIGFIFLISIPGLIAGIGLLKRKEWARILTLIISVIGLFNFPLGTALGIYSIWALVHPEIVQHFKFQGRNGAV
jgi:hypothetical protein